MSTGSCTINFSAGDYVVYPAHGVGQIQNIETLETYSTISCVVNSNSYSAPSLVTPLYGAPTDSSARMSLSDSGGSAPENQTESLKCVVIVFSKDRMKIKVPLAKAIQLGLRRLSSQTTIAQVLLHLSKRKRTPKTMIWSRRAQEYTVKIKSGDPLMLAEVLRDLYRSHKNFEQAYRERQIYQEALERLGREIAMVENIAEMEAVNKIENILAAA